MFENEKDMKMSLFYILTQPDNSQCERTFQSDTQLMVRYVSSWLIIVVVKYFNVETKPHTSVIITE